MSENQENTPNNVDEKIEIINKDKEENNNENKTDIINEKNIEENKEINNENIPQDKGKLKISELKKENNLLNESSTTSLSSLNSSLDSLNIHDSAKGNSSQIVENINNDTFNLTSPTSSKAKATSSTILETASSSVIVNSKNNATSSILHIRNANSTSSLSIDGSKSKKKKSKGKHKAKEDEDEEIESIRNSLNVSDVELADAFMGLASSSVVNKNKEKNNSNDNNATPDSTIRKKGKNKLRENNLSEDSLNKSKGSSAVIEGPFTVFQSSSSSSSLEFLLESAAIASSSHNNDEPPLNINLNSRFNDIHDGEDENDSADERIDINRLVSSSSSLQLGLRYSQKNLDDILFKPIPIDQNIKCTVIRSKMKNMPSYELYIENTDSTFSLLLYSRKVKIGNRNEYVITRKVFSTNLPDESDIVGRLKSNFIGTAFVLYDNNKKHVKKDNLNKLRGELGAILYEPNILGFKGPRKMKIITTRLNEQGEFIPCKPRHVRETLIERSKDPFDREMLVLYNKAPQWNEETQSYVLNFNHRVRIASVKNFQIVNNDDLDYIIMQFGKKKKNIFTLDFRYPFSALLAFGIALSSLDTKIACE